MVKMILFGLWSGLVTAGGVYAAVMLKTQEPGSADQAVGPAVVDIAKVETLSIPIIREGKVTGYVVANFSFAVEKPPSEEESKASTPYLVDAVFRSIYQNLSVDFGHLQQQDLKQLSDAIKAQANQRFKKPAVQDVLITALNYVPRDQVRTNWSRVKRGH